MSVRILTGDCRDTLATLPAGSVQCCVTSPPYYGLRDYGVDGQIGLEDSPSEYVAQIVAVFREVRRVLRDDGTLWLNLGDAYASGNRGWRATNEKNEARAMERRPSDPEGIKPKDLLGIPWMVAFALRAEGWYLRKDIIWHKPNAMPESVKDRPTSAHEYLFLLTKQGRYFYDAGAIMEAVSVPDWDDGSRVFGGTNKSGANINHGARTTGRVGTKRKRGVPPYHATYDSSDQSGLDSVGRGNGRNARDVWTIPTQPYGGAHFATMPPGLAERCNKAGSRPGDTVLDPFGGAGTTGLAADRLRRDAILCELNPEYADLMRTRIVGDASLLAEVSA